MLCRDRDRIYLSPDARPWGLGRRSPALQGPGHERARAHTSQEWPDPSCRVQDANLRAGPGGSGPPEGHTAAAGCLWVSRQISRTPSRQNWTMGATANPPDSSRFKSGSQSSCGHICISSHLVCPSLCYDGEPSLCAQHAPSDEMTTSLAGYRGQWPILPGNFARPSAARKQTRESDWSYNVKTSQLGIGDSGEGAGSPPPRLHAQNSGSGTVRRDGSGAVFRQGAHVHGGPSQLGQHQLFQQTKCAVSAKHTSSNI